LIYNILKTIDQQIYQAQVEETILSLFVP